MRYRIINNISSIDITIHDTKEDTVTNKRSKGLTQPMYYMLLSLKRPRHGYEMMQYIGWLTDGRVKVGPGTLYSLLARFEDDGYIKMIDANDNKKTYMITDLGTQIVDEEVERLELLLKDASRVIGGYDSEFQNRE